MNDTGQHDSVLIKYCECFSFPEVTIFVDLVVHQNHQM